MAVDLLVVDDDPHERLLLERAFRGLPLRLAFAKSAEEALVLLQSDAPRVLLCDYRMPGMDGITLIERVHEMLPLVHCILHTGEAIYRIGLTSVPPGVHVLTKPCPDPVLRQVVLDYCGGLDSPVVQ